MLHIVLTPDGIPGWIGIAPRDGSQEFDPAQIEGDPFLFLAGHRLVKGAWVAREARPDTGPTPEELAERAAEAAAEAEAAAQAREAEILRRAMPDMHLRSLGMITIAEYRARVARITADVEAGA
jgi:hypothetical protein